MIESKEEIKELQEIAKVEPKVVVLTNPSSLLSLAVQNNANVEMMSQLMDLQERYEANEAKKAFHVAMGKFQSIRPELKKSSNVKFDTRKGETSYSFCSMSTIEQTIKSPLMECGLSYRFSNRTDGEKFGVECIVTHTLGHSISNLMWAPRDDSGNKNGIQGIGSTSTYLQRYTLTGALGLSSADEDDDGANSGDTPYFMLMVHNDALRDNMEVVLAIKDALKEDDYLTVVENIFHMPKETLDALWVAPSRGGIFTTKERAQMHCNEYHAASKEFHAE